MQKIICGLVLGALATLAHADETHVQHEESVALEPVVVTTAPQKKAGVIQFNTKTAIQPLPANDGASLLKSVPNMSVIRKGGTSGDPLFRGLGGSRLSIQADDQFIYGGCSNRMDPPTAYIFPTNYDKVVVTKGPQSVTQGVGLVSGSVHFVRKEPDFSKDNISLNTSYTVGSSDRHDAMVEGSIGNQYLYTRFNAGYNKSDDYKDGAGNKLHSFYERNNQMLQVGVTPTANTDVALTYERSRGEAAYADRMVDGSKFDRDAWNVRATQSNITDWLSEVEFRYGQSEIDHIMDNFNLRPALARKALMNPKRKTSTGQLKATLDFNQVNVQVGLDHMRDKHTERTGADYASKPYGPRQSFKHWGAFAEANWQMNDTQNLIAGYRHDQVKAFYDSYSASDPAYKQKYTLNSGFARFEQKVGDTRYYAGLGVAERYPDYWERNRSEDLRPEHNQQIDAGVIWQHGNAEGSVSVFASRVDDFILTGGPALARNIDATRLGGEAEITYRFLPNWNINSSLAYTYGKNKTDNKPLAQTPPLEWKTSLNWDNGTLSAGALWRVVAKQNRYHQGYGNIIGQDLGKSAGFGTLSLNAGWRINKNFSLQTGIDNLFNKEYAEFVSRGGHASAGTQTVRVNEPGRQVWLRVQGQF